MGFNPSKEHNNFIRGDVEVGREGRRDARGHVGRIDDLGLKQDAKKELNIIALSGSEVDEAEPFDKVMEWLELLNFRECMMDQNFFESHRVEAKF